MELRKLKITGFKSVKDEIELLVDPRVTIFIGANDHGKSNLLEAVLRLNDDGPVTEEDVHWDLPATKQPRIEWHFHCSRSEDHTSELQSPDHLVCLLLLEKK